MMMNLGLFLLFVIVFAYVLIPPIFSQESYLAAVRTRYRKILGGKWNLRRQLIFEAGAALISDLPCAVVNVSNVTMKINLAFERAVKLALQHRKADFNY